MYFDRERLKATGIVVGLVSVVTSMMTAASSFFPIDKIHSALPLVYVIPVVVAATELGITSALFTALLSAAAADFFFYAPIYSLRISDPQQVFDMLLYLIVACALGHVAGNLREQVNELSEQKRVNDTLYALSRKILFSTTLDDFKQALDDLVAVEFGGRTESFDLQIFFEDEPSLPHAVVDFVGKRRTTDNKDASWLEHNRRFWVVGRFIPDDPKPKRVVVSFANRGDHELRPRLANFLIEMATMAARLDFARVMSARQLGQEADNLKDLLFRSISHEIVSPLTSISGSAETLAQLPAIQADTRIQPLVEVLKTETARLRGYANTISEATKLQTDGSHPRKRHLDLNDVIDSALKRRRLRAEAHVVRRYFAPDLPLIKSDEALVELAIGELVENAVKYSPLGSVISIYTFAQDAYVIVAVRDEGEGLSANELKKVLTVPFRSARHERLAPGKGIGLWLAHSFVRANGGKMKVKSSGVGKGAEFQIWFSAEQPAESPV